RARRLYERLGFVTLADDGVYLFMEWSPDKALAIGEMAAPSPTGPAFPPPYPPPTTPYRILTRRSGLMLLDECPVDLDAKARQIVQVHHAVPHFRSCSVQPMLNRVTLGVAVGLHAKGAVTEG